MGWGGGWSTRGLSGFFDNCSIIMGGKNTAEHPVKVLVSEVVNGH